MEENKVEYFFGVVILLFSLLGVGVNIACLVSLRRYRNTFHRFMKCLAVFDLSVVFFCCWMYSMPALWKGFRDAVFLPTVSIMVPLVQMSLLGSVYSTVMLSMERYLRLCRMQTLSLKRANLCLAFIFIFPALFYVPKFFEYEYGLFSKDVQRSINCSDFVALQHRDEMLNEIEWEKILREGKLAIGDDKDMLKKAFTQSILMDFSHIETRSQTTEETETTSVRRRKRSETMEEFWKKNEARFPAACSQFTFREDDPKENYIRQIEETVEFHHPTTTELRRNPVYYTVYCVGLNTFFATLLPLIALLFFNVTTLKALRRLGISGLSKETETRTETSQNVAGKSVEMKFEMKSRGAKSEGTMRQTTSSSNGEEGYKGMAAPAHVLVKHVAVGKRRYQDILTPQSESMSITRLRQQQGPLHGSRDSIDSYKCIMRKREGRLTRISVTIVWLFIFCHFWKLVPTAYELLYSEDGTELSEWPEWLVTLKHLSHALISFNSAVNFLIYAML